MAACFLLALKELRLCGKNLWAFTETSPEDKSLPCEVRRAVIQFPTSRVERLAQTNLLLERQGKGGTL